MKSIKNAGWSGACVSLDFATGKIHAFVGSAAADFKNFDDHAEDDDYE